MQIMLDSYESVTNSGDLVKDYTTDGFPIRLYQSFTPRSITYAVQYGKQLDHHLTYAEACERLGQALLHDLACQSVLNNGRD